MSGENTQPSQTERPLLSVVVPCYNEADVLPLLKERLTVVLNGLSFEWEVVFVDDGSSDSTCQAMAKCYAEDKRFKVLSFSRNFGHQSAVMAGLAHASGDAVAVLDADLQDPPELLSECIELWRQGWQVIYCVRHNRKENILKRSLYALFYRLLRFFSEIDIPVNTGDFCLMDRQVVDVLVGMKERNIFVRGMRAFAGFRQKGLVYQRPARVAGQTKYPWLKLLKLAADGIFAFSMVPLRMATLFGLLCTVACAGYGIFILCWWVIGFPIGGHTARDIPGWTAGIVLVILFGSLQLVFLGIIGEYLGRVYSEVKARPRWIIRSSFGFPNANANSQTRRSLEDQL